MNKIAQRLRIKQKKSKLKKSHENLRQEVLVRNSIRQAAKQIEDLQIILRKKNAEIQTLKKLNVRTDLENFEDPTLFLPR